MGFGVAAVAERLSRIEQGRVSLWKGESEVVAADGKALYVRCGVYTQYRVGQTDVIAGNSHT